MAARRIFRPPRGPCRSYLDQKKRPPSLAAPVIRSASRHEPPEQLGPPCPGRHPRLLVGGAEALLGHANGAASVLPRRCARGRIDDASGIAHQSVVTALCEHLPIMILAHGAIRRRSWRRQKRRGVGEPTVMRDWWRDPRATYRGKYTRRAWFGWAPSVAASVTRAARRSSGRRSRFAREFCVSLSGQCVPYTNRSGPTVRSRCAK